MTARRIGFWIGLAGFVLTLLTTAPAGMPDKAWPAAGLVWWMAAWWMSAPRTGAPNSESARSIEPFFVPVAVRTGMLAIPTPPSE